MFGFYVAYGVDEFVIVDREKRRVEWLALHDGQCQASPRISLIDLGPARLAELRDCPPIAAG